MPTFNELRINTDDGPLTVDQWNGFVDEIEKYKTNMFLDELNGHVGIGVSTPRAPLHIVDARQPSNGVSSAENGLMFGSNGASSYKWIQSYGGPLSINLMGNNVGIGTATPQSKLHVVGDITTRWGVRFNHYESQWGANKSRPWLRKAWSNSMGDFLVITATGNGSNTDRTGLILSQNEGVLFGRAKNEADGLSKEWARFAANGNLGIGTLDPQAALHILKSGAPPNGLPQNQNGLLLGVNGTNSYKWIQSYGGDLLLNLMGNKVGIGEDKPEATLHVNGNGKFGPIEVSEIKIGEFYIKLSRDSSNSLTVVHSANGSQFKELFRVERDGDTIGLTNFYGNNPGGRLKEY